jgi:hypothetical protein
MSDTIRNCELPAQPMPIVSLPLRSASERMRASGEDIAQLERAVDFILDDCFFTVGQVVGMRMTIEYEAIVWWRDHYRAKFLAAMCAFGNRWGEDRQNVTGVAFLLAERAVRYAGGRASIDIESARKAAADVERYCQLHARRHSARRAADSESAVPRVAGYWCTEVPLEEDE